MMADALGDDACHVVIKTMKTSPPQSTIQLQGWQAIHQLASGSEENIETLEDLGVHEMIGEALKTALFSSQMHSVVNEARRILKGTAGSERLYPAYFSHQRTVQVQVMVD